MDLNADQVEEFRQQDHARLAGSDSELWHETVEQMEPLLRLFPQMIQACYPSLWSMTN
jgi:hypothetical protein